MLTRALRRVLKRAPQDLQWQQLHFTTAAAASFQAVGSDGILYSLNCIDGTVLEDGTPPGRLPSEIQRHPLFLRTFSHKGSPWGFEVTLTDAGVRRTQTPVRGRFYEFFLADPQAAGSNSSCGNGSGTLVVTEIDERGHRLELLDVGDSCACTGWGADLPPRLRELHSHWLSRCVPPALGLLD